MFRNKVFVISTALLVVLIFSTLLSKSSFCVLNPFTGNDTYSYLALGDSYSAGQTPYGVASGRSYTDIIEEKLEGVGMLKSYDKKGVSGYQTTDVLQQLPEIEGMIYNADIITIDVGINDVLWLPEVETYRFNAKIAGFEVARNAAERKMPEIEANIVEVIKYIKAVNPDKDPRIYLMGYFNAFPNSPEFLPIIEKLNDAIKSASVKTQVNYVDSMTAIDEKLVEYLPGDIHPTVEGYDAIAEVFWEQILEDITKSLSGMPNDIRGHWAEENVIKYVEKGMVRGYEDGSFKPDNPISRAEFVTIINNHLNLTDVAEIEFTDISEKAWYKTELQKAVEGGYVSGYADGTFRPDQFISRQESAVIVAKIMGFDLKAGGNEVDRFDDGKNIPAWGLGSMNALVRNGILNGYPDNTIRCDGKLTRGEVLSILDHMGS